MVPVFGVGSFVWAMAGWWPMHGHWLPENINAHGAVIDNLFMFILVLTGVIFLATTLAMFWFMWRYDAGANPQPVTFTHGSHTLEVVWFQPTKTGVYDIVCAELCGWGHYKMRGRVTIEPREKFDAWLAGKYAEQNQAEFMPPPAEAE